MKIKLFNICLLLFILSLLGCGKVPIKKFYLLNYEPDPITDRKSTTPYPCIVRIKEFNIEKVYSKPQIVYRKSPFELQYYHYQVWAVKPTRMITDIIQKHFATTALVSRVIRRFDEGGQNPDYELTGVIEAIEEYDSENIWFAHIAIRMTLTRLKDNRTIYTRRFDRRREVHQHSPEFVVRTMSQSLDFIMTQAIHDIDTTLAKEFGIK